MIYYFFYEIFVKLCPISQSFCLFNSSPLTSPSLLHTRNVDSFITFVLTTFQWVFKFISCQTVQFVWKIVLISLFVPQKWAVSFHLFLKWCSCTLQFNYFLGFNNVDSKAVYSVYTEKKCIIVIESEARTSTSFLKQDPKTEKVKMNAHLIWKNTTWEFSGGKPLFQAQNNI